MKRTIVTSHWKEDLTWLKNSGHDVVLIDKEGADPTCLVPHAVIPNFCEETMVYLRYIIDFYDKLPDVVAFIHGHEFAYHHKHPLHILDIIERLEVEGFISLNGTWRLVPIVYVRGIEPLDGREFIIDIKGYWHLIEPVCGPCPTTPGVACANSQFMVTRERIRKIPLEMYKKWYDACSQDRSRTIVIFFEYVWHVIFGEPWIQTYNPGLPLRVGPMNPRPTFVQKMHVPFC